MIKTKTKHIDLIKTARNKHQLGNDILFALWQFGETNIYKLAEILNVDINHIVAEIDTLETLDLISTKWLYLPAGYQTTFALLADKGKKQVINNLRYQRN